MKNEMSAILFGLLLVGTLSLHALADSPALDSRGEQFKQEMMPKVGQKITFVGIILPGKAGPYLTADRWSGIYIETTTTNSADLVKLNIVDRLQGHTLKVVGTLHHTAGSISKNPMYQTVPEHFFFDVAEISFSEVKTNHNVKLHAN